jgi:hypothetical protein
MRMLFAGRLVIALIGLAVIAVPAYLIKNAIKDQVDDVTAEVGFENVPANPTEISDDQSLYRADQFAEAVAELKDRAGDNAELLKVMVLPYMAEFQVKDGERAKGYRYYAKNDEMGEFKVKIIGSGSIEGAQFPMSTLSEGITARIEAAVRERDGSLQVTNMNIERGLTNGHLAWSINAESEDRTGIVFNARPNGSGLADPTKFSLRESGARAPKDSGGTGGSTPSVSDVQKQADCIQNAAGDVEKIQACVD